jgi:ATP-dependent protease ClpP protease subunit
MGRASTGLLISGSKERIFPLRGRITKQLASCCIARLLVFATENADRPILLTLDSLGGSINESMGILSTLNGIKTPVATFASRHVGGPAIAILAHGLKGFRVASEEARISFKLQPVEGPIRHEEEFLPVLASILSADTGKTEAEILSWFREGVEFTPRQAKATGIIDAISPRPLTPI